MVKTLRIDTAHIFPISSFFPVEKRSKFPRIFSTIFMQKFPYATVLSMKNDPWHIHAVLYICRHFARKVCYSKGENSGYTRSLIPGYTFPLHGAANAHTQIFSRHDLSRQKPISFFHIFWQTW